MSQAVASAIKKIRMHLCIEQKELGELLGITGSTVSHYETGQRSPRLRIVKKLKELSLKHDIPFQIEDFFNDERE